MLKQITFLLLPILWVVSCNKTPDATAITKKQLPVFSKRIGQVITYVKYPGTIFSESIYKTEYFYDKKGRIDSIYANHGGIKCIYAPNGRIEKTLYYDYYNLRVSQECIYQHNEKDLIESRTTRFFQTAGKIYRTAETYFEYDQAGFVVKTYGDGDDDKTIITRENCDPVKAQRFYNKDGREHYLSIASYDDKYNPLYVAGLNDLFPESYAPHNVVFDQLVHWDCAADYDGSPRHYDLTYDHEGLLLKSEEKSGNYRTEYIYE